MTKKNQKYNLSRTPLESALFKITECSVTTNTIKEYCAELHQIINQLMFSENFYVVLYEQDKSLINVVYIVDEKDKHFDEDVIQHLSAEELRRTLTGYMLRSGKTQHLDSERMDSLIEKNVIDAVGQSSHDWLGVPLKYRDDVLGGMVIQSYQESISYGDQERALLEYVARQIALVLKSKQSEQSLLNANLELEKRVEARTQDLNRINKALANEVKQHKKSQDIKAALFQISELASTTDSLNDLYFNVHQVVKHLMFAENLYLALMTEDRRYVEFPYFVDEYDVAPERRAYDSQHKDKGFTEKVITSGRSLLYYREDEQQGFVGSQGCVSWLGVPLKDKQNVFGVLAIQSYQQDIVYDNNHKTVLLTIGQQVANAIIRKKDSDSLLRAHENLERRVRERTFELEKTIEKRKLIEKKLEHESLHDALTGLPNRLHLANRLNELLSTPDDEPARPIALLFLDLDRFKVINDSLGHHIGDLFLIEISRRLKQCLRMGDMVARLGGDEFCILMTEISSDKLALKLCTRILSELKRTVEVASHSLMTSASIGVRLANTHEESSETIMSDADAAMYQAKHQGKNRFCVFDSQIKEMVTNRMKMERDLRDAVANDELYLDYQPIINIKQNNIEGFEALLRWRHPVNGLVRPDLFIPVAEETGIIVEIGEAVVDMACKALAYFKTQDELSHLYVNINVSPLQILARTLDSVIRKSLSEYKIEPQKLNIEITENILIEDYKAAMGFVRELKSMDIAVYLDDFGTGYSSLSYLHKFPFDAIKLDRSFINALDGTRTNSSIVESIGLLAENLGIRIVAEGIEYKHQLDIIQPMHYELAQGFYFSKPMAFKLLADYVKSFHTPDDSTILQ